jgi:nucleoside-diphosphate-sugar epimerase
MRVLVIGAGGQVGSALVPALIEKGYVTYTIDVKPLPYPNHLQLDATDKEHLYQCVKANRIEVVYHLVALLSAKGEKNPLLTWQMNMDTLLSVLTMAQEGHIRQVFWPSSIAVFGPHSPKHPALQFCTLDPTTMYGITKLAGERLCEYFYLKYGVDVRSLRYPGLISYEAMPGGGTTDYAVEAFYYAVQNRPYTCYLRSDTLLPMMLMDDAIRATVQLMETPAERITIRSSYNVHGFSFTPEQLFTAIRQYNPDWTVSYHPDHRQAIADSWPQTIDDSHARADWDWKPRYSFDEMVQIMWHKIKEKLDSSR